MDRNLLFLHLHGSVANWVINMCYCSLENTIKALLINKPTQVIPMVSEVLCGMDLGAVNQVLVHLLHFSRGAEEEPGRTRQEDSGQLLLLNQTSTVNSLPD